MAKKTAEKSAKKAGIRPLGDKVLLKRLEAEAISKGGIALPDSAKEKPKEGSIIALGQGKLLEDGGRAEFQVKAGDRVLFSSYAGTEVKSAGVEYLILSEEDILAVVE